jgi:hypothetical protein
MKVCFLGYALCPMPQMSGWGERIRNVPLHPNLPYFQGITEPARCCSNRDKLSRIKDKV